ncbi:MAG: methyltransferase domain-containing protein [Alkalinema sp. FL-bin-369]|nr:methyltransferase domain-containing protein [Leptolyngbyaceae cyanobacterium LF-bin-369]
MTSISYDIEQTVRDRYADGARVAQPLLCCPSDGYDGRYLTILPDEIVEKDYGCGDPTRYVNEGDVVVDLGSGAGKNCYIIAQKVGLSGQVIGVDMNDAMLDLSRRYIDSIAQKIGYHNTKFVRGKIQDLALDLDALTPWLQAHPIRTIQDVAVYEAECDRMRRESPLIQSDSVDIVVSNCVLNLVKPQDKKTLFQEIFRVLKRGGRAVISDIVCDEAPTIAIMNDPDLWSGCISGAFLEVEFLQMFEDAGFHGIEILARQEEPWQTIDGIEFRSLTVRAYKGKQGPCLERNQAVIYKGPWKSVQDDDGHTLWRGDRMAVCDKTFKLYTDPIGPYGTDMIAVAPYSEVPYDEAPNFDCSRDVTRSPRHTKGLDYRETIAQSENCC